MIDINELRQSLGAIRPEEVAELLDRLEAAEKERDNANAVAVNIALEAERLQCEVDNLRAKVEAAEKERDAYKSAYANWTAKTEWLQDEINSGKLPAKYLGMHRADGIKVEIDALRAKIEEMEQQAPVAFALYSGWAFKAAYHKEHEACDQRDRRQLSAELGGSLEAYRVVPLYALPGAQGEEK